MSRHHATILNVLRRPGLIPYFVGQSVSFSGSWVQVAALSWYVLRQTGSAFDVGLLGAIETLPSLFVSPIVGAWIGGRRKLPVLLTNQVARALVSLCFVWAVSDGWGVRGLSPLAFLAGTLAAGDTPIRQALMYDLGGDDNVAETATLNALIYNTARLISGPISGVLLIGPGPAYCFAFDAASYAVLFVTLLGVRERPAITHATVGKTFGFVRNLLEVLSIREVRVSLCVLLLFCLSILNHVQIFVLFSDRDGSIDTVMYSALITGVGVGALVSSVALIWMDRKHYGGLVLSGLLMPACFACLTLPLPIWVPPGIAIAFGFMLVQFTVRLSARVQSSATSTNRGAVTGLYFMVLTGSSPVGLFLIGLLVQEMGWRDALVCLCLTGWLGAALLVREWWRCGRLSAT